MCSSVKKVYMRRTFYKSYISMYIRIVTGYTGRFLTSHIVHILHRTVHGAGAERTRPPSDGLHARPPRSAIRLLRVQPQQATCGAPGRARRRPAQTSRRPLGAALPDARPCGTHNRQHTAYTHIEAALAIDKMRLLLMARTLLAHTLNERVASGRLSCCVPRRAITRAKSEVAKQRLESKGCDGAATLCLERART